MDNKIAISTSYPECRKHLQALVHSMPGPAQCSSPATYSVNNIHSYIKSPKYAQEHVLSVAQQSAQNSQSNKITLGYRLCTIFPADVMIGI
jgi:hypothetical protein